MIKKAIFFRSPIPTFSINIMAIDNGRIKPMDVRWSLSKRLNIGFQDQFSLNACQNIAEMEHSAMLSAFIKLPFVMKMFVLYIF